MKRFCIIAVVVSGVFAAGAGSAAAALLGIEAIYIYTPSDVASFTFQNRGTPGDLQICAGLAIDPRPFPIPSPVAQLTLSQPGRDDLTTVTTGFYNDYTACLDVDKFVRGTVTVSYVGDVATFEFFQLCMVYSSADDLRIAVTAPPLARPYCKS